MNWCKIDKYAVCRPESFTNVIELLDFTDVGGGMRATLRMVSGYSESWGHYDTPRSARPVCGRGTMGPFMDQPLYSVIVPTYNPGAKLLATLDAILRQASGFTEVIVVDGGSTDGTLDVLASMEEDIRYVSEPDRGLYDAMNKGIDMARGRYVNFQGAGDILRTGVLKAVAAAMPNDTPAFVYGRVFDVAAGVEVGEAFTPSKMRNGNVPHQAIFYSRDVFDVVGRYELQYPILADYAFNITCFGRSDIRKVYLDRVVADYEGGGVSTQRTDVRLYADLPRLIRENLGDRVYWLWRAQNLIPMSLRRARVRLLR